MLDLTDTDLKQTRFYQDVFTEGCQEEGVALISASCNAAVAS